MKRRNCIAALLAALLLLSLTACREGDLERIWNNERIYAQARRDAARLAEEYILEKYGVEAETLGYDVDGSDVFMAYRASTMVYVALTDGEGTFCVYLSLKDESIRWDNYQRGEVARVLEDYLLDCLGVPVPYASELEFRLKRDRSSSSTARINGKSYDASCMLDFYFDGESVDELLNEIKRVEYLARFLEGTLEGVELRPEDWPVENLDLEVGLERYRDQEGYEYYASEWLNLYESPHVYERPALLESVKMSLELEDGKAKQKRTYNVYGKTSVGELEFVASGPILPENWAEQITLSEETVDWGEEYVQMTPLFCWSAPEDETEWEMRCSLPPAFFEAHGDYFYLGVYDPETGEVKVYFSTNFRPGKPGTFEKGSVYISQSFGMTPGHWYAILLRPSFAESTCKTSPEPL